MRVFVAILLYAGSACTDARERDAREVAVPDEVAPDVTAYAPTPDLPFETWWGRRLVQDGLAVVEEVVRATVAYDPAEGACIADD